MSGSGESPKVFVSYSWSSSEREDWVLRLATRLREDGVDIVLDKWDLKPGHDAYKFMEQTVTDPAVRKVILVCDRAYADKADKRAGGVGVETQIISPEIYGKASQDKFAAIIVENWDDGRPTVPTFYKGRIHFDFTTAESFEQRYEELLRWILDKPELVKPTLGKIPSHIAIGGQAPSQTESKFRRASEALRAGNAAGPGLVREFADAFIVDFERHRVVHQHGNEHDDEIVNSIEAAQPSIRQATNMVIAVSRFSTEARLFGVILGMLEGVGNLMYRQEGISSWNEWDFDNFKFLCTQLFLSTFAILLREARFDLARDILEHRFFIERNENARGTNGYNVFLNEVRSLAYRNQRLSLSRASLEADLLKKYSDNNVPSFIELMQADFFLLLRTIVASEEGWECPYWFAETAPYFSGRYSPFPLFARMESRRFYDRVLPLLGGANPEQIRAAYTAQSRSRTWAVPLMRINASTLGNLDRLGTVA